MIKEHLNFFATLLAAAIIAVLTCWVFIRKYARDMASNMNTILSRQASVNAAIDSHKASIDAIRTKESSIHEEVDRLKARINEVDQYSDQIDQMLSLQHPPSNKGALTLNANTAPAKPSSPPTRLDSNQQIAIAQTLEVEETESQTDIKTKSSDETTKEQAIELAEELTEKDVDIIESEPPRDTKSAALLNITETEVHSAQINHQEGELLTATVIPSEQATPSSSTVSEPAIIAVDKHQAEMEALILNKNNLRLERENDSLRRELEAAKKEITYLSERTLKDQKELQDLKGTLTLVTQEEYKLKIQSERLANKLSKSLRDQSKKIEALQRKQLETEEAALLREEQLKHQLLIIGSDDIKHKIEAEHTISKLGASLRWQRAKSAKQLESYHDNTNKLATQIEGLTNSMVVLGRRDHAHRVQAEKNIAKLAASYRKQTEQSTRLKHDLDKQKTQLVKLDNEMLHAKEQAVIDKADSNKTIKVMQQTIETEQCLRTASESALRDLQAKYNKNRKATTQKTAIDTSSANQKVERLKQKWSR